MHLFFYKKNNSKFPLFRDVARSLSNFSSTPSFFKTNSKFPILRVVARSKPPPPPFLVVPTPDPPRFYGLCPHQRHPPPLFWGLCQGTPPIYIQSTPPPPLLGWLMRMSLAWTKSQKTLDTSKRLHQSTGIEGKGIWSQLGHNWGGRLGESAGVSRLKAPSGGCEISRPGGANNQVLNCAPIPPNPQTQGQVVQFCLT